MVIFLRNCIIKVILVKKKCLDSSVPHLKVILPFGIRCFYIKAVKIQTGVPWWSSG